MADGRKYYCMCDSNCKFETMTKEQILAAIAQAIETGVVGDPDTGYVTKVQEGNRRDSITFWIGTQAEFNALQKQEKNCLYIKTDDTTVEEMQQKVVNAEAAALAAEREAAKVMPVDISDSVTFECTQPQGLTNCRIDEKKFVYCPAFGIVFFSAKLAWDGGTWNAGETVTLKQSGGLTQDSRWIGKGFLNDITLKFFGNSWQFTASENITWGGGDTFTGWYFAREVA